LFDKGLNCSTGRPAKSGKKEGKGLESKMFTAVKPFNCRRGPYIV